MRYAKCCEDCVLNNDGCLLQDVDDVESCEDFDYDKETPKEKRK